MLKVLTKIHKDTEMYKKSFKKFDADGNGFIDKDELKKVLCSGHNKSMSDTEAERLFDEADKDGDGNLSYDGKYIKIYIAIHSNVL